MSHGCHPSRVRTTDHEHKLPNETENHHKDGLYGTPREASVAPDVKADRDDDGSALNVNDGTGLWCSGVLTQ